MSTGPMVPVHDASDLDEARAAVAVLEAHQIPALVDRDVEGRQLAFVLPPGDGSPRVLVPRTMLREAKEILGRPDRPIRSFVVVRRGRKRREPLEESPAPDRPPDSDLAAASVEGSTPESWIEDADTRPIEHSLPDPGSLPKRWLLALAAISFGAAFQLWIESTLGAGAAYRFLGFRSPASFEPWRLLTAGFIHSGPTHFSGNALFGLVLGVVLFGSHRLGAVAFVWLSSSIVGLLLEGSLSPSFALVVGASAGNYGLVGLWARGQLQRSELMTLPRRERIRTLGILCLLVPGALTPITSSGDRVAVLAHVAGFAAGFFLGIVFRRRLGTEADRGIDLRARIGFAMAAVSSLVAFSLAGLRMFGR